MSIVVACYCLNKSTIMHKSHKSDPSNSDQDGVCPLPPHPPPHDWNKMEGPPKEPPVHCWLGQQSHPFHIAYHYYLPCWKLLTHTSKTMNPITTTACDGLISKRHGCLTALAFLPGLFQSCLYVKHSTCYCACHGSLKVRGGRGGRQASSPCLQSRVGICPLSPLLLYRKWWRESEQKQAQQWHLLLNQKNCKPGRNFCQQSTKPLWHWHACKG